VKTEAAGVASFILPDELIGRGVSLRAETPADEPFLERLYIDVRWEELLQTQWPEEVRIAFLRDQFRLQRLHYLKYYHDAEFGVLTVADEEAGRLYLHHSPGEVRIVDISLLSAFRGKGIGTALLTSVLAFAESRARKVSIHVEKFNPAQHLYRRLGFQEAGESGPYWLMEWTGGGGTESR
jgi:ribosomal protein S18 acetylase RimI-like enzyme